MPLFETSFILNFKWKARKITLKKRDGIPPYRQAGAVRFRYSRIIPWKERKPDAD
jgi:hypothetical protein